MTRSDRARLRLRIVLIRVSSFLRHSSLVFRHSSPDSKSHPAPPAPTSPSRLPCATSSSSSRLNRVRNLSVALCKRALGVDSAFAGRDSPPQTASRPSHLRSLPILRFRSPLLFQPVLRPLSPRRPRCCPSRNLRAPPSFALFARASKPAMRRQASEIMFLSLLFPSA